MKYFLLLPMLMFFGCNNNRRPHHVLHEMELVAVPDYYRKIIGYDSIALIYFGEKWDVNFCYPNKKIHKDTMVAWGGKLATWDGDTLEFLK